VKVRIDRSSYEGLAKEGARAFRPGMSATVDIQTNQISAALTVPVQAVTTREDSTGRTNQQFEVVFVVKDNATQMKRVVTGIQDDMNIQILEGLEKGEQVVTAPYGLLSRELKNGDKVEVVSKETLYGLEEKK
jgi:HlyD family secretion protein